MQIKEVPFTLLFGTLKEYHKMAGAEIFHPEERVEFIASKVYFIVE
ncbi:hypothetical protein [Scytonema sp. PCC 10023]